MSADVMKVLSSIETKIFRGFVVVIIGLSTTIAVLLGAAFYAGGIAPALIHRNYNSIKYAEDMRKAANSLLLATSQNLPRSSSDIDMFNRSLKLERGNITEPGEGEIAEAIASHWETYRKSSLVMTPELIRNLNASLESLVEKLAREIVHLLT